jgi:hypothetical protein
MLAHIQANSTLQRSSGASTSKSSVKSRSRRLDPAAPSRSRGCFPYQSAKLVCQGRDVSLTCTSKSAKGLLHHLRSPLHGYRHHELRQDASHAVCQPGESRLKLSAPPTALELLRTRRAPHRGVCHTSHGALAQCRRWCQGFSMASWAMRGCSRSFLRMWTGHWLTDTATALKEHPHTVARFLVDAARRPYLCYREPEGQGGFWVHLQQVPRYRPRVRCHCRRCWRRWSACGLRSRRGWLQHRLYLQALPYPFAHCRRTGWYQCRSRKVRYNHFTYVAR